MDTPQQQTEFSMQCGDDAELAIISLWQPWAQWVMWGWKPIETRLHDRFRSLCGHRIGIHAAQKWDKTAVTLAADYLTSWQIERTISTFEPGQLLGTVFVREARWLLQEDSRQALIECDTRRFGLIFSEPRLFEKSVSMRGCQGIWRARL